MQNIERSRLAPLLFEWGQGGGGQTQNLRVASLTEFLPGLHALFLSSLLLPGLHSLFLPGLHSHFPSPLFLPYAQVPFPA
jgi:hypothetical protein